MRRRFAIVFAALLVSSALMLPSFASANETALLEKGFANRGACESALKQARNVARQTLREAAPTGRTSGQTGAAANQFANPLIKATCSAVTGPDGKTVFKIIQQ